MKRESDHADYIHLAGSMANTLQLLSKNDGHME